MRSLAMLTILCAAAFFLYPLAVQRTASECRAVGLETAPNALNGSFASPAAESERLRDPPEGVPAWALRGWPRPAGCAFLYWQRMLNPPG